MDWSVGAVSGDGVEVEVAECVEDSGRVHVLSMLGGLISIVAL